MNDQHTDEQPSSQPEAQKRPWSAPTMEVIAVHDTEGPSPAFPVVDSITGMS
jgi:hypothetical protein